jgi:type IV pilus assembly protein PilQ
MVNLRHCLWIGAALYAATARATAPVEPDLVSKVEVSPNAEGGLVVLHGTKAPVFSVYRLTDPDRIVVDLSGADVSHAVVPQGTSIPGVTGISTVQFQEGAVKVGRLVLNAAPTVSYDVTVVGHDVRVAILETGSANGPAVVPPSAVVPVDESAAEATKSIASVDASPAETPAPTEHAPAATTAGDNNLVERIDNPGPSSHHGSKVLAAQATTVGNRIELKIETDGPVGNLVLLRLKNPTRIAVDLQGFHAPSAKAAPRGEVTAIRFGHSGPQSARVVFDLRGSDVPSVAVTRQKRGVVMTLTTTSSNPVVATGGTETVAPVPIPSREPAAEQAPTVAPTAEVVPPPPAPKQHLSAGPQRIVEVKVSGNASEERVVIDFPEAPTSVPESTPVAGHGFELRLDGYRIPEQLRRTLDAASYGGPISTVSAFNVGTQGEGKGRIVVAAAAGTKDEVSLQGKQLTWRFWPAQPPAQGQLSIRSESTAAQVAGFTTAPAAMGAQIPAKQQYTGRRISLEFKDIDMQNLLRLFADISHKNIVVSDDVKGKVTIALRNVPWDQAFALILKTHGLGMEESGNIIRVAPEAELEKERKEALDAQKARALLEPLRVRLIPVNYALAGDVSDKLKDILSDRGVVTVDGRTNVLIVKDIPENLAKAEGMVRNLDTQTPQVLVESRIVEAAVNYSKEIGIQWGGYGGFAPVFGNTTGLVFPSTALVSGAAGGQPNAGTAANPNFAVNLPAAVGPGSGGGLGFIFGSAGGAFQLNLRLTAAESNGTVKTVSAPKVATLDNQEASISQGVSIPFAQVSAAGVQTAFIEARLELKVTPHVTSDGSVLMKITATNNQPNLGITGANGQPSISRREAKTQMLVRDGDTAVIGGIYTRATGVTVNQVPFFGDIPVLGWLFKHRADTDQRTELLVFITPRVLNRQQVAAAGN